MTERTASILGYFLIALTAIGLAVAAFYGVSA